MSQSPTPSVASYADWTADLLADGEAILLALKPSPWFVLMVSWPVIALASIVLAAATIGVDVLRVPQVGPRELLSLLCLAAIAARLGLAGLQWANRLYVLTNRRVLRVQGLGRRDVHSLPLGQIAHVSAVASTGERLVGIGSVQMSLKSGGVPIEATWLHVARPQEAREAIEKAIRRLR